MPALCWHRAHAAGPVLLACKAGHPRPDPAHLCGRSVAKNENRLVRSGNRRSVFGRPRRRRCAANCRRCRQPARRPPAPPPEQIQSPQRCQQARRAMAAPSASFGAAAGAGSVASRSSLANAPSSSLALAKTPGARSLWAGACRRGTGVAGGVRAQPALQHPRGSPARPGLGAMSQPSQFWRRSEPDSDAPARGGTAIRGAAGCRRISYDGRGPRRGTAQKDRPPGMPDTHGQ